MLSLYIIMCTVLMKQPRNDACGLYFKYQERVQIKWG